MSTDPRWIERSSAARSGPELDGSDCGRVARGARGSGAATGAGRAQGARLPRQHLSPDELWPPAGSSATLTLAHPVMPPIDPEHPEVLEIDATGSRTDPRYRDEWENDTWHTDVSFMPDPPLGSLLAGVVIPPVGGDTAFADLQAAYDALERSRPRARRRTRREHDGRAEFAEHLRSAPRAGPGPAAGSPCWSRSCTRWCACTPRPAAGACSSTPPSRPASSACRGRERRAPAPATRGRHRSRAHLAPPVGGR